MKLLIYPVSQRPGVLKCSNENFRFIVQARFIFKQLFITSGMRLAAYKVPGYIELRDMLPKSKVGKLLRREVRVGEKRKAMKQTGT